MTYRIVQWTTGNVGKKSVHAIALNPNLQLVGCYAWSPDKVGRDVGELCGIESLGVTASDDVDALLALKPDCVVYNLMFADIDEVVRILGAGINVVTTLEFITGHQLGDDRDRITEACAQGGSTIFGFAIVTAGITDRVDRISIVESFDTGLTIRAMPAITAIPAVVEAPSGIATYTNLPLLLPRGVLATS
jgi:2,4-diaminopentanoate dehydrogenase